jgi:cytochrome c oxidase cbb3-type subunit 4
MDINDLRVIVTVVSFVTFLGIVAWAYGVKSNKQRFSDAAKLPFTDDDRVQPRPEPGREKQ